MGIECRFSFPTLKARPISPHWCCSCPPVPWAIKSETCTAGIYRVHTCQPQGPCTSWAGSLSETYYWMKWSIALIENGRVWCSWNSFTRRNGSHLQLKMLIIDRHSKLIWPRGTRARGLMEAKPANCLTEIAMFQSVPAIVNINNPPALQPISSDTWSINVICHLLFSISWGPHPSYHVFGVYEPVA